MKNSTLSPRTFLKSSLIIVIALFTLTNSAQTPKHILTDSYQNYFNAERETIYLQFNKHKFLVNEAVWFKGYIYDKKGNIPFLTTSNVYITLYNKDGKKIKTNLYYAENGTFHGQFEIDKSISSGFYFFKAHTNWMKNFKEDESYTSEPIEVINPISEDKNESILTSSDYDLQFLPEGGHCIAGATNSIGFKVINCQGQGVKVEGDIVNSNNELVKTFKSNHLGFGKFDLKMDLDKTYTARYIINGEAIETELPTPKPTGFSIATNNYTTKDITYVTLRTNQKTLELASGKTYFLVIHQNQNTSIVNVEIDKLDTKHIISINNKSLPVGVNTITLFNERLQPLLERLFFNYREGDFLSADLNLKPVHKDSISVDINIKDNNRYAFSSNVSVSVLPIETETLDKSRNIISSFLIDPYINGTLENADFYFDDLNRIKSYHLDLAILTQGWSKYRWSDIKKGNQDLFIPFDKGLTIEGTVNEELNPESEYKIQMFSLINNINETIPLSRDKNFSFKNYFIKDSTKVHFNIIKDGKKITQPKLYARIINKNRNSLNQVFKAPSLCVLDQEKSSNLNKYSNIDFNGQVLDTVNIYAKIKAKEERHKTSASSYPGDAFSRKIKVTKDQERQFFFVVDIINAYGFVANYQAGRISIFNRRPISFRGSQSPLLIIDGVNFGRNYDILAGMQTHEIDEIFLNKTGNGYGVQGGAGVIRINLKKNLGNLSKDQIARYANSLLINDGFAEQKDFYEPLFFNKSADLYNRYSAIDWKPELISDQNGKISYKLKNIGTDKVFFVIEGISANGKLLSEIKEVSINKNINN